jgi:hypothetical protein
VRRFNEVALGMSVTMKHLPHCRRPANGKFSTFWFYLQISTLAFLTRFNRQEEARDASDVPQDCRYNHGVPPH